MGQVRGVPWSKAVVIVCVAALGIVVGACSSGDESPVPGDPAVRAGMDAEILRAATRAPVDDADERVRVWRPTTWKPLTRTTEDLVFRTGSVTCRYRVTVSAEVHLGDEQSTGVVAALLPDGRRTLDAGVRGSATWRVTRLTNRNGVRLDGVRVQPLRSVGAREGLPAWLAVRIRAVSDAGDECHAGTWRDVLGPAIGDLLATARRLP